MHGFCLVGTGILNWVLDADKFENDPDLEKIRHDRGYSYQVRRWQYPPLPVVRGR